EFLAKFDNTNPALTHRRAYYQIPYISGGGEEPRKLEIFDFLPKQGNAALVAADLGKIGRTEIYIRLNGKEASIEFRCKEGGALRLIENKIDELTKPLLQKGVASVGASYIEIDEPFNLLSPEPGLLAESPRDTAPKRWIFDMRV
ncbi:MAG: hypothetical protein FWF03_07270, partial [Defluviitaleaceae bacterium]|nr:hypothetical protein [Defluviitaleaceae bacterium]